MNYLVIVASNFGNEYHATFKTKEEALEYAAINEDDDSSCEMYEVKQVKFAITKIAVEVK